MSMSVKLPLPVLKNPRFWIKSLRIPKPIMIYKILICGDGVEVGEGVTLDTVEEKI